MKEFGFTKEALYPQDPKINTTTYNKFKPYYELKYSIIKKHCPDAKSIAEIGVRCGYSAWSFLQACPDAKFYGFDANNGTHGGEGGQDGRYSEWAKKLLSKYDTVYIQIDTQSLDRLPVDVKFDFIHIDGDHTSAGVMHDLDICLKSLSDSKNAMMLIDDYTYIANVRDGVCKWLAKHPQFRHKFVESLRGEILIKRK